MSNVKTIFAVRIHSHPSKNKAPQTVYAKVKAIGQEAANLIDKKYKDMGKKITKVLYGFDINGKVVEAQISTSE